MIPFGTVYGASIDKARFIMMLGSTGGIYCYDGVEDAVFILGDSVQSFYHDGLRRLDPIYDSPLANPVILIDGVIASLLEADTVAAFVSIIVENQGAVYDVMDTVAGIDGQLMLYRGGYGVVTSCTLGTSISLVSVMCAAVRRMSCTFDVFAVVGYKAGTNVFRPRIILLMDPFGIIYGYDNCLNRIARLADNFRMFLRIGTRKCLLNFRYDRGFRGIGRLEKIPYCSHVGNVREVVNDAMDGVVDTPTYVGRVAADSFSLTRMASFGEPIGHELFLGRKNRFFDASRVDRSQCLEGFVADVFSHYDAANLMRAAFYGFGQITDFLWPEEIDGLLIGHPSFPPMAYDQGVRDALENLRVMVSMTEGEDGDSDVDSVVPALTEPPCRRCVERRRITLFKKLKGYM